MGGHICVHNHGSFIDVRWEITAIRAASTTRYVLAQMQTNQAEWQLIPFKPWLSTGVFLQGQGVWLPASVSIKPSIKWLRSIKNAIWIKVAAKLPFRWVHEVLFFSSALHFFSHPPLHKFGLLFLHPPHITFFKGASLTFDIHFTTARNLQITISSSTSSNNCKGNCLLRRDPEPRAHAIPTCVEADYQAPRRQRWGP